MATKSAKPETSLRATSIARGLIRTERARGSVKSHRGMLRLECIDGGFYWISRDGGRVIRGRASFDAEEMQPKFTEAMERAGR